MKMALREPLSLGKPVFSPTLIPVLHSSTPRCIDEPFMVKGVAYHVTCLSFGHPYGVVFTEEAESAPVETIGPLLASHLLFPKGADIVFAQVADKHTLKLRFWKKGEGECDASPQAAGAGLVAAVMLHKLNTCEADVIMQAQSYHAQWHRDTEEVLVAEVTPEQGAS